MNNRIKNPNYYLKSHIFFIFNCYSIYFQTKYIIPIYYIKSIIFGVSAKMVFLSFCSVYLVDVIFLLGWRRLRRLSIPPVRGKVEFSIINSPVISPDDDDKKQIYDYYKKLYESHNTSLKKFEGSIQFL